MWFIAIRNQFCSINIDVTRIEYWFWPFAKYDSAASYQIYEIWFCIIYSLIIMDRWTMVASANPVFCRTLYSFILLYIMLRTVANYILFVWSTIADKFMGKEGVVHAMSKIEFFDINWKVYAYVRQHKVYQIYWTSALLVI